MEEFQNVTKPEIITSNRIINLDEVQHKNTKAVDEEESSPKEDNITQNKTKLILELEPYQYSRFTGLILEKYPNIFTNLNAFDENELEGRLKSVKMLIQCKNNGKMLQTVWKPITMSYEGLTKLIGLNTTGISNILSEREDILDLVEECRLKYCSISCIEPEKRLLLAVIQATYTINVLNNTNQTIFKELSGHLDKPVKNKENLEKLI